MLLVSNYFVMHSHADWLMQRCIKTNKPSLIFLLFCSVYSLPAFAERPTNGALRHAGHILADKTQSQFINIHQNLHLGKTTVRRLAFQRACMKYKISLHKFKEHRS